MRLANKSTHARFKHGVAVVRGGSIISTGYNHGEHHAEVVALRKIWPNKRAATVVWSVRVTKTGRLAMAKPCADCESYMRAMGVKGCFYSTPTGEICYIKFRKSSQ